MNYVFVYNIASKDTIFFWIVQDDFGVIIVIDCNRKSYIWWFRFFFVTLHPICENWLHLSIIQINLILLRFAQLLHPICENWLHISIIIAVEFVRDDNLVLQVCNFLVLF